MKKELEKWQKAYIEKYGLLVYNISGGQIRRFGPTINEYEVIDVYLQYNKDQVLTLCSEHVEEAKLPVSTNLMLWNTVLEFKKIGFATYYYKCGHDYTD